MKNINDDRHYSHKQYPSKFICMTEIYSDGRESQTKKLTIRELFHQICEEILRLEPTSISTDQENHVKSSESCMALMLSESLTDTTAAAATVYSSSPKPHLSRPDKIHIGSEKGLIGSKRNSSHSPHSTQHLNSNDKSSKNVHTLSDHKSGTSLHI